MNKSDLDLLRSYCRDRAEDAFGEIVRRHLGLVYSAALRQVRSPQLAEEVAQSVFLDLARQAACLSPGTVLVAWLYQVTRRTAIDVARREARRQLREQVAAELNRMNASADAWMQIEPLLDEAMHALDEVDRTAVLLRYFENKSLRDVSHALGTTEDAAQKRVSRAVERLRSFFSKRGIATGAIAISAAISTNAVQAAPAALATAIIGSSGAALGGASAFTATDAFIMTTTQKLILGATLVAALGTGLYELRRASLLDTRLGVLQQQQDQTASQLEQEVRAKDVALRQLAGLREESARLARDSAELLRLRAEVARLRPTVRASTAANPADLPAGNPATEAALKSWLERVRRFKSLPERMPDKAIPELRLLTEEDWLELARKPLERPNQEVNLEDERTQRLMLSAARAKAKDTLMRVISRALEGYANANDGLLPTDATQLKLYVMNTNFLGPARVLDIPETAVDDDVLQRYEIVQTGKLADVPGDKAIVVEKAPVDAQYDTRLKVGKYWMGVMDMEHYSPEKALSQ